MPKLSVAFVVLLIGGTAAADGPADNHPDKVRAVPPLGIELDEATAKSLLDRAAAVDGQLGKVKDAALAADVRVITRAVRGAVEHREFFKPADVTNASKLLKVAEERAADLSAGKTPWAEQTGRVIRGFVSKLDETPQPYGLVVPDSYAPNSGRRYRMDVWLHGRGERSLENQFLWQRMNAGSQYEPEDTFVLHPYGRYSNAFKFAGEIDVIEAIADVKRRYGIDDDRIAIRGFSMGGAGCWQLAVHYPDLWYAANPGAGFSETPEFLRFFQKETLAPRLWEKTLWQWYDCPVYAVNLAQCPTVAYSGEVDIQKQAADLMESSLAEQGIDLVHVIGPKTGHKIHPQSKVTVQQKMDRLAEVGRDHVPQTIHFATPTLRYGRCHWLQLDGLEKHWTPARVDAELHRRNRVDITTANVTALTLTLHAGEVPFDLTQPVRVEIDEQLIVAPSARSDRSWTLSLVREKREWRIGGVDEGVLRKRPGLQGPIDDAFLDSFVFVRPTGKFASLDVEAWVDREMNRAVREWRRQFRGDVRIVDDSAVTEEMMSASNVVLWGDPSSNAVLGRMLDRLPIVWREKVQVGDRTFDGGSAVPLLIHPNPLAPNRYVVLNSGPTYREYAYLNNARQVPMLPDWAVVDAAAEPSPDWPLTRWPGRILGAGFFDEEWKPVSAAAAR